MYKFICAHITKPRNATNSYKKLTHNKKIHQDSSRPQTATTKEYLDENPDETQEHNEEENGGQECPSTSTSPSRMQKLAVASKLPSFKTLPPTPALRMKEYPRFYTGNFIIVDPPTPSISKKYYHIYSISPSSMTKRPYSSISCKKFLTDEAKENYKRAMENIYSIQKQKSDFQFRMMNISTKPGSSSTETWGKKVSKKKVPEIRYPTHTIKHNLTLTKRYKIREGSAERKTRAALEEKFKMRKKLQSKAFKNVNVKKVTYPKLATNFKKIKISAASMRPENKNVPSYEDNNTARPHIAAIKNKRPSEESTQISDAKRAVEREYGNIDRDFETLIKSHPTIENASKEAKMKLKTKFIQLLLKTARSTARAPKTEVMPTENVTPKEEYIKIPSMAIQREEEQLHVCKKGISEKDAESTERDNEVSKIVCHPKNLDMPTINEEDYMLVRYPKRVWVEDDNTFDLQDICIKDNTTRRGTGLITNNYAKESPKPNYKKVEEEAQELSKFVDKFKHLQHTSDEKILKLKKGSESSDDTSAKLEELRKARLNYINELAKLNVKLTATSSEADAKGIMINHSGTSKSAMDSIQTDDRKADSPKSANSIGFDNTQKRNLNKLKKREDLEKIRKILTGEMRREGRLLNKRTCEPRETKSPTKTGPEVMVNVWKDKRVGQRVFYKNKPNHSNQKNLEVVNLSESLNRTSKSKRQWPFPESTNKTPLRYPNKIQALNTTEEYAEETKQGHTMPKAQMLNRSKEVVDKPLEMGNPPTDMVKEQTFKTLNTLDIHKNIICKKVEPAEQWEEKIGVDEEDAHTDITHTPLTRLKAAEKTESAEDDAETVAGQNKLSTMQAKTADDTLDEINTVDELNERAREREEEFRKRKSREEERMKRQKEREKMKSWSSNKTLNIIPRIDKADDYKDEQYQRGEEVKRKIEQIVPKVQNVKLNVTTEHEQLNEDVEKSVENKRRYSVEPEVKSEYEKRTIFQETDLKTEQGRTVREESDEFHRKKQEEWNNEILEGEELEEIINPQKTQKRVPINEDHFEKKTEQEEATLEEKTKYEALNETAEKLIKKEKQHPNKGYTMDHPVVKRSSERQKRIIQENNLKTPQGRKINDDSEEVYGKKRQELVDGTCRQDKTKLKSNQEGEESASKSGEYSVTIHPKVMRTSNAALENEEYPTDSPEENIPRSKSKGTEDFTNLEKQTKHLIKAIKVMESKKIVSPIIQENRDQKYPKNERTAAEEYREEVLQKYFDPKILPGTNETVYTPKERLIVNNIEELNDNEEKMELGQESKSVSDTAVLRRGDEIVIFEKNPPPKEICTESETNLFHMKLLDKALSLRNEGALTENKLLLDTKSKIDEMVDKINSLETILKEKQELKQEEKKSENKPRIPPPKPPTEKERKDIKKDKPKGPNDMVLPPKIRGSTPEKRPKEHNETEKSAANQGEVLPVEKEKPIESQTSESPGITKPKSCPQQNLESNKVNQTQNVTTEIRNEKGEKADELPINANSISAQKEKHPKGETEVLKMEKIPKDPITEKEDNINAKDKLDKQCKIPVTAKNIKHNEKDAKTSNQTSEKNSIDSKEHIKMDRALYDPHTEKVRNYFAKKYGLAPKSDKIKGVKERHAEVRARTPTPLQKSTDIKKEIPKSHENKMQMQKVPENKKKTQDISETKVHTSNEYKAQIQKKAENKTQMQKTNENKAQIQELSEDKTQKIPDKKPKAQSKMQMKKPPEDKSNSPKPPENQQPPENEMKMQKPPENEMQMQKPPEDQTEPTQSSDNKQQAQKSSQNAKQEHEIDAIKVSLVKKIVRTPKSKSLTRGERGGKELVPEAIKVLHPTKSTSHLDKVRQSSFETVKPVRSGATLKGSTRTSSSRSQMIKIGMRGTKAKYSSWSMQGITGRQITSALDHRAALKKITSDEKIPSLWRSSRRSASDASRKEAGPKKPKVLMNNNYFRRSAGKEPSEDERRPLVKTAPKEEAASKRRDEVPKPVVFTKDNSKQSDVDPLQVQEEKAKRIKILELAKVTFENDNVASVEPVPGLSKAMPRIFWADTSLRPQSQMVDKYFKQVKPIIELSNISTKYFKSENKGQEEKANTNTDLHLLEKKPVLELSKRKQKFRENSMIERKTIPESPKLPSSYTTPDLCLADNNLKQEKPLGTLNVRLPKSDRKTYLSLSAERRTSGRGTKLPGYSSETKVLTGKKNPKLIDVMDLENSENKMSIAGISTTPTVKKLDDKDFSGPRKSIDKVTEVTKDQKIPEEQGKDKTAIFRIQYDGEVFIVKKANETLSEAIEKKKKEQTLSDLKPMGGSTQPITELKQTAPQSTDLNDEDIIILEKYNTKKQSKNKLESQNKGSGGLEEPSSKLPATKSASRNQRDSAKPDVKRQKSPNIRSAEDSKPKLTAKVEEIIVKPMKEKDRSHSEDGPREKVKLQQPVIRTDPILKKHKPKGIKEDLILKQSLKDNANDTKSYNAAQVKKPSMLAEQKQNTSGITQERNLSPDLKECAHHDTLEVPSNNTKAGASKKEQEMQQPTMSKNVIRTNKVENENKNAMHHKTESRTPDSTKNATPMVFTKSENIYISKIFKAANTPPENNNTLSKLPSNASTPETRDVPSSVKETPKQDISHHGIVKSDCVEKSEIPTNETTNKQNDMYDLNDPKTNPQIPTGSLYTIRVPNFDSDKREPSLYRVKILPENIEHSKKTVVAINPRIVKINENTTDHRNLLSEDITFSKTKLYEDHLKMMEPKKSVEILYTKELKIDDIKSITQPPKSTPTLQFQTSSQPKDDGKITEDKNAFKHTYNSSPKVKAAENKPIIIKPTPSPTNTSVLKAKPRKSEIEIIKKAKTEGRIIREKPEAVEVSRSRSVEKLISKDNLIAEIEAWASNTGSVTKRKVKSEQEKVRPKQQAQMKSNIPKRKKMKTMPKITTVRENKTETVQKPLKTSQSEHIKVVLPETPTDKNDSVKEKAKILTQQEIRINESVRSNVGDARRPFTKYAIDDDDDKFESVDKSLKKNAQRVLSDLLKSSQDASLFDVNPNTMNMEVAEPPALKKSKLNIAKKKPCMLVSKIDEMKRKKKLEIQRNTKKHKEEQHARQQEKRFKKEEVEEINDVADEIYQKEKMKRDTIRGTGRQDMHQKDVKVIQPSVGSGPWGTKIKKPSSGNNDDKKSLHDGTNIIMTPSKEKLMSKSEFLKFKQLQIKRLQDLQNSLSSKRPTAKEQTTPTSTAVRSLKEIEFQRNIQEIQKNLTTQRTTETELHKQQNRDNKHNEEARLTLTDLGNELHKYLSQNNKHNENTDKNVLKGKDGRPVSRPPSPTRNDEHLNKPDSTRDLYNRIDQEIETKLKSKEDWPTNALSSETLTFKITKMAEKIANDLRLKEENARVANANENMLKSKEKQHTTITEMSPQVTSENESRFGSEQVKMWSAEQAPTENKSRQTKDDSVGSARKDFILQSKNIGQSGQQARTGATKGYSEIRRMQKGLSADDASKKSINRISTEKLTSSDHAPNSFDKPSLPQVRKEKVEEMMEMKRGNKMSRRVKTTNLKNMLHEPTPVLNTIGEKSGVNDNTKQQSATKENEIDKEETGTNIAKGPNFIFKPENLSSPARNKANLRNNLKTRPKYENTSKVQETTCEKIVLPLRNPQVIVKKLLDPQMTTLDKPWLDKIKTVPKEILEAEEKAKKVSQKLTLYGRKTDPLAKYRHLKITYMAVNRKVKKEDEKFLPAVVKKIEDREIDEENKNQIINFRFELLRRLNEEFKKQLAEQTQKPPVKPRQHKTPKVFDNDKLEIAKSNLESDIKSFTEINMKTAKLLSEIKPIVGLEKGLKNTKKSEANDKGGNKKKRGTSNSNNNMFPPLKPDNNDENGPGDVRRTQPNNEQSDSKSGKTDIWSVVSDCTEAGSRKNQACMDAQDFDVLGAVPHAFTCPSPQLEERRQENLYYRYHQMTFLDLHQYLGQKRAFAFKAAEKNTVQDHKHKK